MLKIGTTTQYGKIAAIGNKGGERYYMMVKNGVVSLMPAVAVEGSKDNG